MLGFILALLGRRSTDSAISLIVKGIVELEKVIAANERKQANAENALVKTQAKTADKVARVERKIETIKANATKNIDKAGEAKTVAALEAERAARIKAKLEELVS